MSYPILTTHTALYIHLHYRILEGQSNRKNACNMVHEDRHIQQ